MANDKHHLIRAGYRTIQKRFFSKNNDPSILAYVEDHDDKSFWDEIFLFASSKKSVGEFWFR